MTQLKKKYTKGEMQAIELQQRVELTQKRRSHLPKQTNGSLHEILLFAHVWSGCDTTSAIYRQGEILVNTSHTTKICYKMLLNLCCNSVVSFLNHVHVISPLVRCHIFKFRD